MTKLVSLKLAGLDDVEFPVTSDGTETEEQMEAKIFRYLRMEEVKEDGKFNP